MSEAATIARTDATITKTVILAAPRQTVWEFLTRKDKLAAWFHEAEADLSEGDDYALITIGDDGEPVKQCWGTVLAMDPPSKLVWSFTVKPLNGVMTTVTWTLEEISGGTKLTLVHEGLDVAGASFGLMRALDAGWDQHFARLRKAAT